DYKDRPEEGAKILKDLSEAAHIDNALACRLSSDTDAATQLPELDKLQLTPQPGELIKTKADLVQFLTFCVPTSSPAILESMVDTYLCTNQGDELPPGCDVGVIFNAVLDNFYSQLDEAGDEGGANNGWRSADINSEPTLEAVEAKYRLKQPKSKKKRHQIAARRKPNHIRTSPPPFKPQLHAPREASKKNEWDVVEQDLATMSEIFPDTPKPTLRSLYHKNGRDLTRVINHLLGDAPTVGSEVELRTLPASIEEGGHLPRRRPTAAVAAPAAASKLPSPSSHKAQLECDLVNQFKAAREWLRGNPREPTYCRERAAELTDKRNAMYLKAFEAYQARGTSKGHSGIAAYYSQEAS
ncbi:hypothetical protein EV182_003763, partial [Spiromyces aspiralis]